MSCSVVQVLPRVKAVFDCTESVTFEDAEGNKQEREEAMFDVVKNAWCT